MAKCTKCGNVFCAKGRTQEKLKITLAFQLAMHYNNNRKEQVLNLINKKGCMNYEKTFNKNDMNAITRTLNIVNDLLNNKWNTPTISIKFREENVEFTRDELNRTWLTLLRLKIVAGDSIATKTPMTEIEG